MKTEIEITLVISLDKDFFEFLKQKNCLEEYISNVKIQKKNDVRRFFENLGGESLNINDVDWVLTAAFPWSTSPEGHNFWSNIKKQWHNLCITEWCKDKAYEVQWLDVEAWEEVFTDKLLAGKRYIIRDSSWNRPALEVWQSDTWEYFDKNGHGFGWRNLVSLCPEEGVLILSDYPVKKTLVDEPGHKELSREFIKVLLPDGRAWWVLYDKHSVL